VSTPCPRRRCGNFWRRAELRAALALFLVVLTGCRAAPEGPERSSPPVPSVQQSASSGSGLQTSAAGPHVVVIVFENHKFEQIIGNSDAPYFNKLADKYGLATSYEAVSHPSLPNYLALTGGSTFGITSDCTDCSVNSENLADQLEGAGLSWRAYLEDIPSACYTGAKSGNYAKKHNPFIYYDDIAQNRARCDRSILPVKSFTEDLAGGTLPNFSFVAPDLCHDMHDCSVSDGDTWLSQFLPDVLSSRAFRDGLTVFVTFDEGTNESNHVPTFVINRKVSAGNRFDDTYTHYSLLRTIEDIFGLSHLGHAGDPETASMIGLLGH
jgi:hypothetical protein